LSSKYRSNKPVLCRHCAGRNRLSYSNGKCSICQNQIFERLGKLVPRAKNEASNIDFSSFSVSSKIPADFELAEEELWDKAGILKALSLKTQLNSELASSMKKELKKEFDPDSPDISFSFDFVEDEVGISINPVYLYGHYRKFSRDISQTKWPCDCKDGCALCGGTMMKYRSVEELVAGPLLAAFCAKGSKFHGAGREDVDARMLGDGRPFIFELEEPLKRNVPLSQLESQINESLEGKVEISRLSFAPKNMVEMVKQVRLEKSYRAIVETSGPISQKALSKIPKSATLNQQTPNRVLHRRSDLERIRHVKGITHRQLGQNSVEITMKTEAGTYVKEFISGDGGRTKPSVSEFLGVSAVCKELDVIKVKHDFLSDYW